MSDTPLVRESTAAASRGDLYGPPPIQILRQGSALDKKPVDGFVVPGTEDLFGVYLSMGDTKKYKGRWVSVHIPTGLSLRDPLPNRDLAEALCCWMYCNCADKMGLRSDSGTTVVESLGARVRSYFLRGQPFLANYRKKKPKIGSNETHQSSDEQSWIRMVRELQGEGRDQLEQHIAKMAELGGKEIELATLKRKQAHYDRVMRAEFTRREEMIVEREDTQAALQLDIANQIGEAAEANREVARLRDSMLGAIAMIDVDAVLGSSSIGRALRKVRLSSDPEVHDESN